MEYKKLFFPIGGGEELRERIQGALLIAKYFNSHLEIFKALSTPSHMMHVSEAITPIVLEELNHVSKDMLKEDLEKNLTIVQSEANKIGIQLSNKAMDDKPTAELITGEGYRSKLIEQESKYCDLVLVASPHNAKITATFEATVTKSGKPALMFPRKMEKFNTNHILIAWNNSPEVSQALSQAIPLIKQATKVQIVTSDEFTNDSKEIEKLQSYLNVHGIKSSHEVIKTTIIPGKELLNYAQKNEVDLIVAGAFGHKGFKELMLGGTTEYILEHTTIPIFMSH